MQAALEAEISEFLDRDRYARGEQERAGYRNGHAELTVKTTAGPVCWSAQAARYCPAVRLQP
jgi:putative transposase